ncbi:MAG TPA: SDR family oxidoreductase [Methylophilus sp.]
MSHILVTGANGFVGKPFCGELLSNGYSVRAVTRTVNQSAIASEAVVVGNMDASTDWSDALTNIDVVVHLAARVHVMNEHALDPLAEFRKVNVAGTLNLANQAAKMGVRRFVFVSSVKVNGEHTLVNQPFTADDTPHPQDPYGQSKLEAEQGLMLIAQHTDMEVVIVRPPLIYGRGVKANFASMLKLIRSGWPIPLGAAVHNRRSFVGIDNLVDFLLVCIAHPAAANQVLMVSDGEDLSTAELFRRLGVAIGHPAKLFYMPTSLLTLGASLLGKQAMTERLLGNLQVDITKNKQLLGWQPPITVNEGFRRI